MSTNKVTCRSCKATIEGYERTIRYIFVDGQRFNSLDTVRLDCGCEALDHSVDVSLEEGLPAVLRDDVRRVPLVSFSDV
jgi:hypothetical protein